jgi:hypothetical protein
VGTKKKQRTDKDLTKIVDGLLDGRALLIDQIEQKLKKPHLSNVENVDLIALVCVCWFAVLGRIIKVFDKPEENWRTILARGESLIDNLTPRNLAAFSYLTSDFEDLRFIVVRWFWWNCCYGELVKRVNQQDHYLECTSCDYKAAGIIELRKHSQRNHTSLFTEVQKFVGKLEKCKYCTLKVTNLRVHLLEKHPEALEWKQKQESEKKAKEVVFPPRTGKAFVLSLWKDDKMPLSVPYLPTSGQDVRRSPKPSSGNEN